MSRGKLKFYERRRVSCLKISSEQYSAPFVFNWPLEYFCLLSTLKVGFSRDGVCVNFTLIPLMNISIRFIQIQLLSWNSVDLCNFILFSTILREELLHDRRRFSRCNCVRNLKSFVQNCP